MLDALGKELTLGQRVALTSNSTFKIGVLYKYQDNRTKRYRDLVEYVNNPPIENYRNTWRDRYYTQARVEEEAFCYYVRFLDGKTRTVCRADRILGVEEDATI